MDGCFQLAMPVLKGYTRVQILQLETSTCKPCNNEQSSHPVHVEYGAEFFDLPRRDEFLRGLLPPLPLHLVPELRHPLFRRRQADAARTMEPQGLQTHSETSVTNRCDFSNYGRSMLLGEN